MKFDIMSTRRVEEPVKMERKKVRETEREDRLPSQVKGFENFLLTAYHEGKFSKKLKR